MKNRNDMSSYGTLTTIVYGAEFERRKAFIAELLQERFSDNGFEQIEIDLVVDEFKSKELQQLISKMAFSSLQSKTRVIIFYNAHKLSNLMQNILLKTLEEPTASTSFILEVGSYHALLPTIQSRSMLVSVAKGEEAISHEFVDPKSLVDLPLADLFKQVEKYADERESAASFISYIMTLIKRLLTGSSKLSEAKEQQLVAFADFLLQCHEWVIGTNVSPKTVLENVVLGYRHCMR